MIVGGIPMLLGVDHPVMSFLQAASSSVNASSYTYAAQNFGTAESSRKIVAVFGTDSGAGGVPRTVSSCTIGGVTATKVLEAANTANGVACAILIADVPTGTSGDVVVGLSGAANHSVLALYHVTLLSSSTAHNTASDLTGDPSSATIDIPAGGFAIAGNTTLGTGTMIWTGLTENSDTKPETDGIVGTASGSFAAQQTGLTVTSDDSVNDTRHSLVIVSWGN